MPIVTATRLVKFNAGHRVYNPTWSDERNHATFGKCSNPNFHGHNYTLEITVEGSVDPETGYVMDLGALKLIAERELVQHLDHKNLNLDVPFLTGTIPTTENLVLACWRVLAPLVAPQRLVRLKLWETDNHYVEYDGR